MRAHVNRHCRWCGQPVGDDVGAVRMPPARAQKLIVRKRHCGSPTFDWCAPCVRKREAARK